MRYSILFILALVVAGAAAWSTGTVTVTQDTQGPIKTAAFGWVSNATGEASVDLSWEINGELLQAASIPSSASAPSDNYDVTLTDAYGVDVLHGNGANRDASSIETIASASLGVVANSTISISVTNAGSAKAGQFVIWYR